MMLEREKITAERADLLRSWVHSGFHVNSDRRVEAGDRRGLESLLEYMERAPVALERLTYRSSALTIDSSQERSSSPSWSRMSSCGTSV